MTRICIPDRWLLDLQLVGSNVRMELHHFCDTPLPGTVVEVDRYGSWEVLQVLRPATLLQGALLLVRLLENDRT